MSANEKSYGEEYGRNINRLVEDILNNPRLLQDYGYDSRNDVKAVVIYLQVNDRVDPDLGLGYTEKYGPMVSKRNKKCREITETLINDLQAGVPPEKVREKLAHKQTYQVIHLTTPGQALCDLMDNLHSLGYLDADLGDKHLSRIPSGLLLGVAPDDSDFVDPFSTVELS